MLEVTACSLTPVAISPQRHGAHRDELSFAVLIRTESCISVASISVEVAKATPENNDILCVRRASAVKH
jgi:hypothetical protein